MHTVGLIPARGGSKRLPGKNMRYLAGKHLIEWTIQAAMASALDAVYVSTEDAEIAHLCSSYDGLHLIERPDALADDLTPSEDVIRHALDTVACDRLMLLQPTSPLRTRKHIDAALKYDTTVSVYWDGSVYKRNGAIYLMRRAAPMYFTTCMVMPGDVSIDIDTIADLQTAEELMAH